MMICGGGADGPEFVAATGRTSSWAILVLLDLMLAAIWQWDYVVILGQAVAARKKDKRQGDWETRRFAGAANATKNRSLLVSMPPGLLVSPPGCHGRPPTGKVDALNQKELPRVCRCIA